MLCIGVPFQYTESRILKARLQFLREKYRIRENDFLSFDAMRHAAQCLGRVLRGKDDYGIMVLADKRFLKKKDQLPKWIEQAILDSEVNLSTDMAVGAAKKFLRGMAQPFKPRDQEGISTWSLKDLENHKEKQEEESIRALKEAQQSNATGDREMGGVSNGIGMTAGTDEYGFDDDDEEAAMLMEM